MENVTTALTSEEPIIYWPDFGPLQYAEVIYMTLITVLGAIGNLIVIFSIALEKRVHAHGNIFIINLAVADLLVSSLVNPTVIAHIINGRDAIGVGFCYVIGYLVTSTCTCSLLNLMFVAINRYWAVVRPSTYQKTFRRRRVYYMMAFTWIVSALLVSPTVLGWGRLVYDAKILVCLWDDTADYGYTWFITTLAVLVPMAIIGFCYVSLFRTVRGSGRWVRSLSVGSGISQQTDQHRRSMQKERSLLKTLITTVVLFCICWVPFALCVLINPGSTPPHLKKIAGWLALTNSCVNFIIYGAMNPVFRRGYRNLFIFVFRCKREAHFSSAMLHGSFSDSYRTRRAIKGMQVRNGCPGNDFSDINRDSSRNDSFAGVAPGVSQATEMTVPGYSPNLPRIVTNKKAREQSPLAKRSMMIFSDANRAVTISNLPTNSERKKGFVQAFRNASSRRGRPRANTSDNLEDKARRAKRISAMLLQVQVGDDLSSDEDEFKQAHEMRYARRSQSELPPGKQGNGNSNNLKETGVMVLSVKDIANEYLRRSWIPDRAVYTSKQSVAINGSINSSPKVSPTRKIDVATVSNGLVHTSKNQQEPSVESLRNGDQLSPSKATPSTAVSDGADYLHADDVFDDTASDESSQAVADDDVVSPAPGELNDSSDHDSIASSEDAKESGVAER